MTIVNIRPGARLKIASRGVTQDELDALLGGYTNDAEFAALQSEVVTARSGQSSLDARIDDIVEDSINAAPSGSVITGSDRLGYTDAEDSFALKKVTFSQLGTAIYTSLGPVIAATSSKPTLEDADAIPLADSSDLNNRKKITWAQFRGNIATALGAIIVGVTNKATPANADDFALADSAAGDATKRISWEQIKAALFSDPAWHDAVGDTIDASGSKTFLLDDDKLPFWESATEVMRAGTWSDMRKFMSQNLNGFFQIDAAAGPTLYTGVADPPIEAWVEGTTLALRLPIDCAANPRLKVGTFDEGLFYPDGSAIPAGGLRGDTWYIFTFKSSHFELVEGFAYTSQQTLTDLVETTIAELTEYVDQVAEETRNATEDLSFSPRPGRDPRLFAWIPTEGLSDAQVTAAMMGTLEAFDPLPDSMIAIDGQDGAEVRAAAPGVVVLREAFRIDTDGLYKIVGKVRRRVNATDPANDSVQIGVQGLNAAQGAAVGAAMVVETINDLTVASGRVTCTDVIATAAATGVTLVAPAGAIYGRLYARFWGTTPTTALQVLTVTDIAGATYNSPDVEALEAELDALQSENLPTRVTALEEAGTAPEIARFKTRSAAAAATIGATVDLIEVLGNTADTDGHVDTYGHAVGGPASAEVFQTADGGWWQRQYHSRFADFATLDAVTGAAVPAWQNEIVVAKRDTNAIAHPFICRNAGLSDPPHTLFRTAADGRRFEFGESVANCQKIGMSPTRAATENYARLQEAISYANAKKVAVYLPGAAAAYQLNPGGSSTYLLHAAPGATSKLSIIGDGFGHSVLKVPNGTNYGGGAFTGFDVLSILDITLDCNWPNQVGGVGYQGLRLQDVDDAHIRVQVLDAGGYGIGNQGAPYRRHWYERLDIRRSASDGFDWKNTTDDNGDIFLGDIYIEDPCLGRPDADGAGFDGRGRFIGGRIVVVFKSAASVGVGFRLRQDDSAGPTGLGGRYSQIDSVQVIDELGTHTYLTSGLSIADDHVKIGKGLVRGVTGYGYSFGSGAYQVATSCTAVDCGGQGFFVNDTAEHLSLISPRAINCGEEGFRLEGATNLTITDGVAIGNNYGFLEVGTLVEPQFVNCHAEGNTTGNWNISSPTARFQNCIGNTGDVALWANDAPQAKLAAVPDAVNYVRLGGTVGTTGPFVQSEGTATNLDLRLIPKGTGSVRFGGPVLLPEHVENWRGHGGDPSDTGCLLNAIAAAKAAGGMKLRLLPQIYTIEETLLIDASHISLIGEGSGFPRASLAAVQAAPRTSILWDGAAGGTIVRFNTPAGMERQMGGGIQGIQLDGNSFLAARGLVLESWVWGNFEDIHVFACSESQFRFEVVNYALLPAQPAADTQYNVFKHCQANTTGSNATEFINSTAIGWHLTGGSPINIGNTSGNTFISCHAKTSKGIAWKLENCDDNLFFWVGGAPVYDEAVASLELGSMDQDSTSLTQPVGPGAARYNMFFGAGFGEFIHARSSQTGLNSSRGNQFFGLARSNAAPLPVIETPAGGAIPATIHYWDTTGNIRINSLIVLEKDIAAPAPIADHSQLWIDAIAGPVKIRDSTGAVREVLDTASRTGDWTPAFSFATPGDSVITHTVQLGKYQKLGNFVLVDFDLEFNTNAYTTAAGAATISGLPFISSTIESTLSMGLSNVTFTAGQVLRLSIPASGASVLLRIIASNAVTTNAGTTQIPASKTGVRIRGAGMYWTAA